MSTRYAKGLFRKPDGSVQRVYSAAGSSPILADASGIGCVRLLPDVEKSLASAAPPSFETDSKVKSCLIVSGRSFEHFGLTPFFSANGIKPGGLMLKNSLIPNESIASSKYAAIAHLFLKSDSIILRAQSRFTKFKSRQLKETVLNLISALVLASGITIKA